MQDRDNHPVTSACIPDRTGSGTVDKDPDKFGRRRQSLADADHARPLSDHWASRAFKIIDDALEITPADAVVAQVTASTCRGMGVKPSSWATAPERTNAATAQLFCQLRSGFQQKRSLARAFRPQPTVHAASWPVLILVLQLAPNGAVRRRPAHSSSLLMPCVVVCRPAVRRIETDLHG